jgi:3-methyladenine DNA glycosylase/8-oxoguanine DNA glycosylase
MVVSTIPVRTPFPWRRLLSYLSHRMIPGVERIEDASYVRHWLGEEIRVDYDEAAEELHVRCPPKIREDALVRARFLFQADHACAPIDSHLSRSQPLSNIVHACPGLRPLGTWSGFELCCRTILGQQVTVAAANTLMRRLMDRCGTLTPDAVLAADLEKLGMPGARVRTLQSFASAVKEGRVDLTASWAEIDHALKSLPGFGPWTRTYLAIRLGREPDAFPATDVGLLRASGSASTAELLELAESWRPFRAHAAAYLWMHG